MPMTSPRMTKVQATALAHFVNSIRPEWDKLGIVAACGRMADRDPAEVGIAMLTAAKDPGAQTPAAFTSPAYWAGWGQTQVPASHVSSSGRDNVERLRREAAEAAALAAGKHQIGAIRAAAGFPRQIEESA